jgi:hypothetical protein
MDDDAALHAVVDKREREREGGREKGGFKF